MQLCWFTFSFEKKACLHNNTANLLLYQYKTDQKDIIADHF